MLSPSENIRAFPRQFAKGSMALLALGCLLVFGSVGRAADSNNVPPAKKPIALTNSLGMKFREVPGTPVLFSIWETRLSDWNAFLNDTKYKWDYRPHFPQTGDHPVVNITLQDALAFCNWLTEKEQAAGRITAIQSYRLPTNKEWDAAVGLASGRSESRGLTQAVNDEKSFPWGTQWPPPRTAGNLNFTEITGTEDGFVYTAPVGSFDPSPDGLYDLAGNAWEWAWDQEVRADIVATLRGGSWMYFRKECLFSAYRYQVPADLRAPTIGFRCVLEDKHSSALFVEAREKTERANDEKQRQKYMEHPGVSDAEVKKVREELTSHKGAPVNLDDIPLPDIKTLKPAKDGAPFTNSLGMTFRPAGTKGVLVCEYETRVHDYHAYLDATKREWARRPSFEIKPSHPIMNVTWKEATDFCAWLTERDRANGLIPANASYRLPTDTEWSTAAGLPEEDGDSPASKNLKNTSDFPWGRDQWPPPVLSANLDALHMPNYHDDFNNTAPVGRFTPNTFELYDMAGNVAEWCSDAWPGAPGERVVRGSSWLSSEREAMLTSARRHLPEAATRPDVGFRCVLALPASAASSGP